jgi:predicted Zn finger-like uncharacterized protein
MPAMNVTCPECGAVLRSSKPVQPGKTIKCPKCGETFPAPGDQVQAERPKPAARAQPAGKRAAPPAPAKRPVDDDDDDGPGTYAVLKEEEKDDDEDDDKPDLTFGLDMSIKDPRGQAQMKVVRPSNWLILSGAFNCIFYVVVICWCAFPFIFNTGEWLDDAEMNLALGHTWKSGTPPPPVDRTHLNAGELDMLQAADLAFLLFRVIIGSIAFVWLIIAGIVVYGGVRMQNLESWGWSLAGSILGLLNAWTILGVMFAIWCIIVLNDPKVREGFRYQQEHKDDV